jgi:predicted component of type VI protein secretion system
VFKRFQPSVEVQLDTVEGEEQAGTFDLNSLADFQADNLVAKNELLTKAFNEVEVLKDLVKQLSKNKALLKALNDPEKKASFLKFLDSNIKRLG